MTLVLSEVVSLLIAAAVWLTVAVALGLAAGFAVVRWRRGESSQALRASVVGGLLSAGVSSRLGLSDPVGFEIWGRPLPPLWVLGGAVAGAALMRWRQSLVRGRGEGSAASPAPGAARP